MLRPSVRDQAGSVRPQGMSSRPSIAGSDGARMLRFPALPQHLFRALLIVLAASFPIGGQTGVISTIAGNGGKGFSGDGGPATAAQLNLVSQIVPRVAADAFGNVYFADVGNHRVRRVDRNGVITTVAGNGAPGFSGDGGPATAAQLLGVGGLAVDGQGNLFIADIGNHRIRRVALTGLISTVAGMSPRTGTFAGDGGPATSAELNLPVDVAVGPGGNLYIADTGNYRVRKVGADGTITTVAGNGGTGVTGDRGTATEAQLSPAAVDVDASGNLYVLDSIGSSFSGFLSFRNRVRRVDTNGIITTVAGVHPPDFDPLEPIGDGGPATAAKLLAPQDIAVDSDGNLYISDALLQLVRKVDRNGIINTVAGNRSLFVTQRPGFSGDGGAATSAQLNYPAGLAADLLGNFYVADALNQRIRRVAFAGPVPQVSQGGVVNAASFSRAVAPGSIISVFGTNLALATLSASVVPVPTSFAGVSVRINGVLAPIFFVSRNQLNVQLPFEIQPGTAQIVVSRAVSASEVRSLDVAPAAPGLFQVSPNRAVVQNQDLSLNGPSNPAEPGSVIVAYLTGQGQVDNSVPTGHPAPVGPLARPVAAAAATMGGHAAELEFIGLTPGSVGLLQANVRVPTGVSGDVALVVSVGGVPSNPALVTVSTK